MIQGLLHELREQGWAAFSRAAPLPRLNEVLVRLRATSVRGCSLVPVEAHRARPNTLSARYGFGSFPLHTDGAHTDCPPRYILLTGIHQRKAGTLLMNTKRLPCALMEGERALFRVTGGRQSHYARFVERRPSGHLMRYNVATHTPINEEAKIIAESLKNGACIIHRVDWTDIRALIIDNWSCLHGREQIGISDQYIMRRLHVWTQS